MNLIDLLILGILGFGIYRGAKVGLARQGLSLVGFFGGLFIGSLLAPHLVSASMGPLSRLLVVSVATLGLAAILSSLGELAGLRLRQFLEVRRLTEFDAVFGSGLEIFSVLATVWLMASVLTNLPLYRINAEVRGSAVVKALDKLLPPAPNLIAKLEHLIDPNGFPNVFLGPEPAPAPVSPNAPADVQAVLAKAGPSTVKIEGFGCGGIVEGSGFVAAPGYIITNAHVVAGVSNPVVRDRSGIHQATVVSFDSNLDLAVLRVSHTFGPPLAISSKTYQPGTAAVVLGYPGGGSLSAGAAVIYRETIAVGRNIYNSGVTDRSIYELEAGVQPGNSGGPLVLSDGTVVGVVFAKSVDNDSVGYALTTAKVVSELHQAETSSGPVGTGSCAAE
jgi:S1-C subfamily serine protease